MLIYDEQTGEYFDTDKVDFILSVLLLAYAPRRELEEVVELNR